MDTVARIDNPTPIFTIIELTEGWEDWKDCEIIHPDGSIVSVCFIDKETFEADGGERSEGDIVLSELSKQSVIHFICQYARVWHNAPHCNVVIGKFAN